MIRCSSPFVCFFLFNASLSSSLMFTIEDIFKPYGGGGSESSGRSKVFKSRFSFFKLVVCWRSSRTWWQTPSFCSFLHFSARPPRQEHWQLLPHPHLMLNPHLTNHEVLELVFSRRTGLGRPSKQGSNLRLSVSPSESVCMFSRLAVSFRPFSSNSTVSSIFFSAVFLVPWLSRPSSSLRPFLPPIRGVDLDVDVLDKMGRSENVAHAGKHQLQCPHGVQIQSYYVPRAI